MINALYDKWKDYDFDSNYDNTDGYFLNYTQVEELYGDSYNLAPRKQFCYSYFAANDTHDTEFMI